MRVTHMMQFNISATNLRKQNSRLFEAQQEAATGKKTVRPSDGARFHRLFERAYSHIVPSDKAQSETSKKVLNILRAYAIKDWQSVPKFQHMNPVERRYQTIKR